MKKILSHGTQTIVTRKFVCPKCACIFEADQADFFSELYLSGVSYRSTCPECLTTSFEVKE